MQNHPFFNGVEWDVLETQPAPYTPPQLDLPEPKLVFIPMQTFISLIPKISGNAHVYSVNYYFQDGASEHWTVSEYFSDDAFSESTNDEGMRYGRVVT